MNMSELCILEMGFTYYIAYSPYLFHIFLHIQHHIFLHILYEKKGMCIFCILFAYHSANAYHSACYAYYYAYSVYKKGYVHILHIIMHVVLHILHIIAHILHFIMHILYNEKGMCIFCILFAYYSACYAYYCAYFA